MNFRTVDYASIVPPRDYRCTTCGAHGCKLWREYQTFLNRQTLECLDCVCKSQSRKDVVYDPASVDTDRRILRHHKLHGDERNTITSIGWRVLAAPTEEGDTYWGYSSVPGAGLDWWWALPTRVLP